MSLVKENSNVTFHYLGKLSDGKIFDSSMKVENHEVFVEDKEPLKVELGKGSLIPGFEKGLVGMEVGEEKTIVIKPEDAYGMIDESAKVEVPKGNVPPTIKEGEMLSSPDGMRTVLVKEIKEETVVLDTNHPLAGKELTFFLKVVSVD